MKNQANAFTQTDAYQAVAPAVQAVSDAADAADTAADAARSAVSDDDTATDAALNYLQNLYQLLHSWPLALASYNCGEGRVQKEMALQGVSSYYYLSLPEETERYVFRALAAKIVLEDPARYGYDIPAGELYPPLEYDEVSITLLKDAPVRRLAEACGSYYKAIKTLNPWIKGQALPPGTYRLKLPKGSASRFQEAYRRGLVSSER